jgi:hypothetical protein
MLPPYALVRFFDVQQQERAEPLPDDIHTLLSVQSSHVGLRKSVQKRIPYRRLGLKIDNTLKTSALDETISQGLA